MKIRFLLLTLLCYCVLPFGRANLQAQDESVQEAKRYLASSNAMLYPTIELGAVDLQEKAAVERLFEEQMKAIRILSTSKDDAAVQILIPYLNYGKERITHRYYAPSTQRYIPDINELRSHQLVFSIITGLPNAATKLADYALDSKKPLRLRLAAFHVLKYLNPNNFTKVATEFNKEIEDVGPKTKLYVAGVEAGTVPFDGISPFDGSL